jgi:hypothetical protein
VSDGQNTVNANKIFVKNRYSDVWSSIDLRHDGARCAADSRLCHIGQIPPELIDKPHPRRMSSKDRRLSEDVKAIQLSVQRFVSMKVVVEGTRVKLHGFDENLHYSFSNLDALEVLKSALPLRPNSGKPLSRASNSGSDFLRRTRRFGKTTIKPMLF